jgi:hypothetical protein
MPCVTPFGLRTDSHPFNDGLNRYRGCDAKRSIVDAESEESDGSNATPARLICRARRFIYSIRGKTSN